jgi:dihydroorotate dehydrogenase
MLVKIAPDLSDEDIDAAGACLRPGVDGVIATNTTVSRFGMEHVRHADQAGGLSANR